MKLQTLVYAVMASRSVTDARNIRGGDSQGEGRRPALRRHSSVEERDLEDDGRRYRMFQDMVEPGYRQEPDELPQDAQDAHFESLLRGGADQDQEEADQESQVEPDKRIINGVVSKGKNDFHCSLVDHIGPFCGATLVSNNCVATAAHCLGGSYDVVCGRTNVNSNGSGQSRRMRREHQHPQYNDRTTVNDYAIVCVDGEFDLDKGLSVAKINSNKNAPSTGTTVRVLGFGDTDAGSASRPSKLLMETEVKIISNSDCDASSGKVGGFSDSYKGQIKPNMVCAKAPGTDACQGDSGGPMGQMEGSTFVLHGIVSWGIGCASPDFPGVYARCSEEYDWMRTQICKEGGDGSIGLGCGNSGGGNNGGGSSGGNNGGNNKPPNPAPATFDVAPSNDGGSSGGGSSSGGSSGGGFGSGGGSTGGGSGHTTVFREDFKNGGGRFKNLGTDTKVLVESKWRKGVLRVQNKGAASTGSVDVSKYSKCQAVLSYMFIGMDEDGSDKTCVEYSSGNGKNYKTAGCISPGKANGEYIYSKRWYDDRSIEFNVNGMSSVSLRIRSQSSNRKEDTLISDFQLRCRK